ncbi:hypothetical protein M8818_004581 [Zalaria obscura]|uniref:Uncharacterized protein n=1 Tax=Zalaria obscura TaxID=2024903 RepID=A0ACC3SCG5_9PEZI
MSSPTATKVCFVCDQPLGDPRTILYNKCCGLPYHYTCIFKLYIMEIPERYPVCRDSGTVDENAGPSKTEGKKDQQHVQESDAEREDIDARESSDAEKSTVSNSYSVEGQKSSEQPGLSQPTDSASSPTPQSSEPLKDWNTMEETATAEHSNDSQTLGDEFYEVPLEPVEEPMDMSEWDMADDAPKCHGTPATVNGRWVTPKESSSYQS